MKKNPLLLIIASLLLVGVVAFAVLRKGTDESAAAGADGSKKTISRSTDAASGDAGIDANSSNNSRSRDREGRADQELIAKYGEARTGLSRHITRTIADLLDDAVFMGEMTLSGQLGNGMGRGRMQLNSVIGEMELTDEQREKAEALLLENQQRNLAKLKDSVTTLREKPEGVMGLLLASDAFKRGDITEDEYKRIQEDSAAGLEGLINPLDRNNFRGGQPLEDETFVAGMRELLDDQQNADFQDRVDNRPENTTTDITSLPNMELEQLDQAVTSGKKLTGGIRQMMEGMGGLQEMAPLLEQRR